MFIYRSVVVETSLDRNGQTEKDETKGAHTVTANTETAHAEKAYTETAQPETTSPNRTEQKVLFRSISTIVLEKWNCNSMFRKQNLTNNYKTKQFLQKVLSISFAFIRMATMENMEQMF